MLKMKLRRPQEGEYAFQYELVLLCDSCHRPIASAADCYTLWRIVRRHDPGDPTRPAFVPYEAGEPSDSEPIFVHEDCSGYYVVEHQKERWQEWLGSSLDKMWPFAVAGQKPSTPSANRPH